MKSLSLKLQERIFQETEALLEKLKISRNAYINEAIAFYNRHQQRKLLAQKLKEESRLVAENSMEVLRELEQLEEVENED
jgi:hypothetical protein